MRIQNSLKPHVAEVVKTSFMMEDAIYQMAKQACADSNPDMVFLIMKEFHKVSALARKVDQLADC